MVIDLFKTPIDLSIAISFVLFLTNIVKPDIILNAATTIIKVNIIVCLCICKSVFRNVPARYLRTYKYKFEISKAKKVFYYSILYLFLIFINSLWIIGHVEGHEVNVNVNMEYLPVYSLKLIFLVVLRLYLLIK